MDNLLTHSKINLDLWLEAELSGELNKNQVYSISNTTAEDLYIGHSVSTIDSSWSGLSSQSVEFQAIVR